MTKQVNIPGRVRPQVQSSTPMEHEINAPLSSIAVWRPPQGSSDLIAQVQCAELAGCGIWSVDGAFSKDAVVAEGSLAFGGPSKLAGLGFPTQTVVIEDVLEYALAIGGLPVSPDKYQESFSSSAFSALTTETVHMAGATPELELGWLLAKLHWQKEINSVVLPAEREMFMTIAKCRATRRLLEASFPSRKFTIVGVPSRRTLTAVEPQNNHLRITYQVMGLMFGGCDVVASVSCDEMLEDVSLQNVSSSAKVHAVLRGESHLDGVSDPGRGSFFVEDLTGQLCDFSFQYFRKIEDEGGAVKWVKSGRLQEDVARCKASRKQMIMDESVTVVGVTKFKGDSPAAACREASSSSEVINWHCDKLEAARTSEDWES